MPAMRCHVEACRGPSCALTADAGKPRGPRRAACLSSQPQAQASDAGQQQHEQHQHDHSHSHSHDHARLHSPYHTTSVTTEAAVNMAGFQALLARMVVTPGEAGDQNCFAAVARLCTPKPMAYRPFHA